MRKRAFELALDGVCHEGKADVGGVAAVGGAEILIGATENARSVDVVDVLVLVCSRVAVGVDDHVAALDVHLVLAVKIHARDHNIGDLGVSGADLFVHLAVGRLQVRHVGRIVVVVAHESGHLETAQVVHHGVLRPAASRKAEVDIVQIHVSADDVLIDVARSGGASPLRDRASVVNHGGKIAVFHSLAKRRGVLQTDEKILDVAVGREVDGEIAQTLFAELDDRFIPTLGVPVDAEGAVKAADPALGIVDEEIKGG